jgi:2-polyprenyl-3-methyl-5-hydroxy-6-metoxy-1,4-benzoquinol methylase
MKKKDSKELWLEIDSRISKESFTLGPYASDLYFNDPAMLAFITSRYKFCAKMLSGFDTVMEIGCGDAFGGAILAKQVNRLICLDINEPLLKENSERMKKFSNIEYKYHDFRVNPYSEKVDAVILVDVIEHIYLEEENKFLSNIKSSLNSQGVCLIGTPNIESEKYASKHSRDGHVNLKSHVMLKKIGSDYFHNSFLFSMNDEVVHTGLSQMAHYLWILCVTPRS